MNQNHKTETMTEYVRRRFCKRTIMEYHCNNNTVVIIIIIFISTLFWLNERCCLLFTCWPQCIQQLTCWHTVLLFVLTNVYFFHFSPHLLTHTVYVWMFVVIQSSWLPNPRKIIIIIILLLLQWYSVIVFLQNRCRTYSVTVSVLHFWFISVLLHDSF